MNGNPLLSIDPTGEVPIAPIVYGYAKCMAQCMAVDAASEWLTGGSVQCLDAGELAKSCALDCVNPVNWLTGGKFGAAKGAKAVPTKIDRNVFRKDRETYWKTESKLNPGSYSPSDLERMKTGKAPIGPDGKPMELHHRDGTPNGPLDPMTMTDHRGGENYKKNHPWIGK